jgi:hypothetical protein
MSAYTVSKANDASFMASDSISNTIPNYITIIISNQGIDSLSIKKPKWHTISNA